MAKIYLNDRKHLIIQMNSSEATKCNFGIPVTGINNICLCGTCNTECTPEDIYYVCGINEVLCKDCVEDYAKNMNHYTDSNSIQYEVRHFNTIAEILNMKEKAVIKPNGEVVYEM